jgi:phosphonate transport system substrate-binding protein
MSARVLGVMLAAAVLAAAPTGSGAPPDAGEPLRFAVLPCTNIEATFKKFHPLLAYVESETGLALKLVVPADLAEFETATANGQLDLALQDPHTFEATARHFDEASLLQARGLDGSTRQSAVVVVRRDGDIGDLAQLRGRSVMFGPRTSSPKWVAARELFESKGLDVARDLKPVNGGCCEDIAFAVSLGAMDAGVICDHFLRLHDTRQKDLGVDPDALRVLARTTAVPTRIFAARRGLAPEIVAAVTRALARLDGSRPGQRGALETAELGGFLRTTRAQYLGQLHAAAGR